MLKKRYRLLWGLAKGLHRSQAKAVVAVCNALIRCGQMRSFSIAHQLASGTGVRFKSAVQRFYRLMHNRKLDDWICWSALAHRLLAAAGERPLVAVDWTEWHSGLRVLAAAVCVGRRAIPIYTQTSEKQAKANSQNTKENAFLHKLHTISPLLERAVLIFDRGFRRVSFLLELRLLHGLFIVRLAAKVHVYAREYGGLLREYPLKPGQLVDLGVCALRKDGAVKARVIGVWAKGQKEPWWLATNLEDTAGRIAEYYDRRMSVEEAFRDGKGCRFGIKMKWTKFRTCAQIDRLFLLAAMALSVWTLAGILAWQRDPTLLLLSKSKGRRRSLVAIGIEAKGAIDEVLRMGRTALRKLWLPADIRSFAWEKK
jgi:hypothetical protein